MNRRDLSKHIPHVVIVAWFVATVVGFGALMSYSATAGDRGQPPPKWPLESHLKRDPLKPTIVTMVHPHCPCGRARLTELANLMTEIEGAPTVNVVFVKPKDVPANWENTGLANSALYIPGITMSVDNDAYEATLFRSHTSGQIMLYGTDDDLLFSGGITTARGQVGESPGRRAIFALISKHPGQHSSPVYGCPLFSQKHREENGEVCDAR